MRLLLISLLLVLPLVAQSNAAKKAKSAKGQPNGESDEQPEKKDPISEYSQQAYFHMEMSGMKYKMASIKGSGWDEYFSSISKIKAEMKDLYNKAIPKVKKAKAREALKAHYVAFITALDGINSKGGESEFGYAHRQEMLKDKLTEAWTRFEVEE